MALNVSVPQVGRNICTNQNRKLAFKCFRSARFYLWGETGGSETPASHTFYSRFPRPSVVVPAFLFHFYCKMLRSVMKVFSFSPGSHHFGNSASRPFSSPPPAHLPPPILPGFRPLLPVSLYLFGYLQYFYKEWKERKLTNHTVIKPHDEYSRMNLMAGSHGGGKNLTGDLESQELVSRSFPPLFSLYYSCLNTFFCV